MPSGSRVRSNNAYGVTTDNPLTAGATSFNSLALTLLPNITVGQHAIVVLDPKRVFGQPEIVIVTVHVGLSTTATITRGAYGTIAASHAVGTAWAHVDVSEDYISILTSITRPSDPYEGQYIYETDTKSLKGYNGSIWNSSPPVGTVFPYLGASAPTGYLLANGAAVSRTGSTADLFGVIGTTYGAGDGSTTYNLPDFRGRVPVGQDTGQTEFDVLGEKNLTTDKVVVLDSTKLPQHLHGIQDFQHNHGQTAHDHSVFNPPKIGTNGTHYHANGTNTSGSSHDHLSTGAGQAVMVVQTAGGPFNVNGSGSSWVTFDVGHTSRTDVSGSHNHGVDNEVVAAIMQPVLANIQLQATGIVITQNSGSVNPSINNLQPYIVTNYIIKI